MSSILGNMENVMSDTSMPRKRKIRTATPPPPSSDDDFSIHDTYADTSSDGPVDDYLTAPSGNDYGSSPFKKPRNEQGNVKANGNAMKDEETFDDAFDDMPIDDFAMDEEVIKEDLAKSMKMEVETDDALLKDNDRKKPAQPAPVKKKEDEGEPAWLNVHASLAVASADSFGPLESNASKVKSENINALEEDGSLRFFWIDYLEQDGRVYFIGKLKDKTTGVWISCCVTVDNLQRNLFLLPRERQLGTHALSQSFSLSLVHR